MTNNPISGGANSEKEISQGNTPQIPKQLQNNQFRFIKIKSDKTPLEESWSKVKNYLYSDPEIIDFIKKNKRYGVVCGYGNLVVIDFDSKEIQEQTLNQFPDTFMTKTANKGLYHLYYICDEQKGFRLKNIFNNKLGDVQGQGTMVVGPSSLIMNEAEQILKPYEIVKDVEIAKINMSEIKKNFAPCIKAEKIRVDCEKKIRDPVIKQIVEKIKISEKLNEYGISITKNPTDCPFHDSEHGKCLSFNDSLGLWHCFNCDNGGTVIQLVMEKEGMDFFNAKCMLAKKIGITINEIDLIVPNREEIVNAYHKIRPFFYDNIGMFWFWNNEAACYQQKDEFDLMNDLKHSASQKNFSVVSSGFWGEMNRALKLVGRTHAPKEWNKNWIQFNNDVVDISNGEIHNPTPEYFNVNPIPHKLGDDVATPNIDLLFTEWVGSDHILELKELCFFCMIQDYPIHRLFFLFGAGLNGKGAFMRFLAKLIGQNNICSSNIKKIIGSRFEASKLYKKLVCLMGETNFHIIAETETLKQLTGQDLVTAEYKGLDSFDFQNYAKIIIASNCLPPSLDNTIGWHRRLKIIDFPNQFPEGNDPLKRIPDDEYSNFCKQLLGIGVVLLNRGIFVNDGTIQYRQQIYEERSNPFKEFINSNYEKIEGEKVAYFRLYDKFVGYLEERKYRIMSKQEVSILISNLGLEIRKEHVQKDGKDTTWNFVYGIGERTEKTVLDDKKNSDIKDIDVTGFSFDFSRKKTKLKVGNIDNIGIVASKKGKKFPIPIQNQKNEYQDCIDIIKDIDKGQGFEADDFIQEYSKRYNDPHGKLRLEYAKVMIGIETLSNGKLMVIK